MKKDSGRHRSSFRIIGNNIKAKRESLDMSQEELAFAVKSARNYIGCIERAEKFPSVAILLDIAKALNCKFEDLVKNI